VGVDVESVQRNGEGPGIWKGIMGGKQEWLDNTNDPEKVR
jgi:hypothetical protein